MFSRRRVKATFSSAAEYGVDYVNVEEGEVVNADLYSTSEGWTRVVKSGTSGWVLAAYLEFVECLNYQPYKQLLLWSSICLEVC